MFKILIFYFLLMGTALNAHSQGELRQELSINKSIPSWETETNTAVAKYSEAHLVNNKCNAKPTKLKDWLSSRNLQEKFKTQKQLGFADRCCDVTYYPNGNIQSISNCNESCTLGADILENQRRHDANITGRDLMWGGFAFLKFITK